MQSDGVTKLEQVAANQDTLSYFEQLSEDLAADRQQLIELDRKQQHNRETLRQVFSALLPLPWSVTENR
jgi:hypothetical protein